MNLTTFIAFRHLRSPQKGSFSTLAGILAIAGLGIGIAALIITLSILEGFETTISEKIAGFYGYTCTGRNLHLGQFAGNSLRSNGHSLYPEASSFEERFLCGGCHCGGTCGT